MEDVDGAGEPQSGARFISRVTKKRNSSCEESVIEWVRNGISTSLDIAGEMGLSKMASSAIELGKLVKKGRAQDLPDDQEAVIRGDEIE